MEGTKKYLHFGAMIATSMLLMYGVMYLNTYAVGHVFYSETRLFMTLLMGAVMGVVMLGFMWKMYEDTTTNAVVITLCVVVFAGALWLVRSQTTVGGESYMRAMIPHHSIAILTSERAEIEDVRVEALAEEIAATQRLEIKEMKWLLDDIEENGTVTTEEGAQRRPIPDFEP